MKSSYGFGDCIRREIRRMGSRPAYLIGMVVIPLAVVFFFVSLLGVGLPQRIPNAVVDLDQSSMSRQVRRTLEASQLVSLSQDAESYDRALEMVRSGEIYGFFVIPAHFERDALAGRTPTLEYYSNMTYFVPGTLSFKGFKQVAVTTSGGLARNTLISLGVDPQRIGGLLQPVAIEINPLNNPWMNYSIYMSPSFSMATFVLMIMIMTVMSITGEIKDGTSPQWLATARGRISVALAGKMLPHTIVYCCVGLLMLWVYFGWQHFPLHGNLGWMMLATFLLILASQGFALFICCIIPNPRLAYSVCALFGVLSYSFAGFSMPVTSMYGGIAIFSWLAPVRYWYLIFLNEALNGFPLYYARWFFVALIAFAIVPWLLVSRLRKAVSNPVYVP